MAKSGLGETIPVVEPLENEGEDIMKSISEGAQAISLTLLPQKCAEKYLREFDLFSTWRATKKILEKNSSEAVMLAYFNPSIDKIALGEVLVLMLLTEALETEQISRFLSEADDKEFLFTKSMELRSLIFAEMSQERTIASNTWLTNSMADKSEDVQSTEDKITLAKELYGTGCRSYLVKSYLDAVDDLSRASELFAIVYGDLADELGMPYLMYAKSLIAVAQQGENKILEVPDEENEEDNDDDDNDKGEDKEDKAEETEEKDDDKGIEQNGVEVKNKTNGTNGTSSEPQPGTSSVAVADDNQEEDQEEYAESDTPAASLQLAWEVLELAVQIFTRQGEPALSNLAEAYFELAEISFENSHFETAVADYRNSEKIRMNLPDDDLRLLSVIQYKIGLSYYMDQSFVKSIEAFKKASDMLECRIETLKSKDNKSEKDISTIADLEEMKEEVLAKIDEIEEMKRESTEEVKKKLAEYISGDNKTPASTSSTSASGSSSTSIASSSKPKPTDISHLIKRKKPETVASDDEAGPLTKKPSF